MSRSDLSVLTTCISIAFQRQSFPLTPTRAGAFRHFFRSKRVQTCRALFIDANMVSCTSQLLQFTSGGPRLETPATSDATPA